MYALPRGPSKIVACTRRGPPRVDVSTENNKGLLQNGTMSAHAKMTFNHSLNHNGKHRNVAGLRPQTSVPMTKEHREAADFLRETWDKTMDRYHEFKPNGPEWYMVKEGTHPTYASRPTINLKEFVEKTLRERRTAARPDENQANNSS